VRAPRFGHLAGRISQAGAADDRGSQSVELALILPGAVLLLSLLLHGALLGADLVAAQTVAVQAARVAAVDDDAAVLEAAAQAAGGRPLQVTLEPDATRRMPGDVVTATVRLRSSAFTTFGATVWCPGRAAMRVEDA